MKTKMPRRKTKDITDKFKGMRKCKIIELCKSPEVDLTDEELNIFLLRLYNYNYGVSDKVGKCERAQTRYLVEQQAAATQAVVNATANTTQTKIDFYAYQDLRDRLNESERKVMALENQLFVKDQLAPVNAQLADIKCQMLKRPDVTGIGAVCPNAGIINGLGINNLNGYGCGCNGLA